MPEYTRISDPARIRALAHPVRLALLDFLHSVDEATVTECAEHLDESPASCSYHLRMLEKYGYVERGTQRGREKPWREAIDGFDMRPDPEVPGSMRAVQELAVLHIDHHAERLRDYFAHADTEPDVWVQASTLTTTQFWVTHEELAELSQEIQGLVDRFRGRDDESVRPSGARRARLFAAANPEPLGPTVVPDGDTVSDAGRSPDREEAGAS